jgi:RNA polymerase sigma-70 factor (ECF subfamily)
VQDGDREAFEVLVERYQGMVFDLTHQYAEQPEAAEDLAQDVFLRAYRRIEDLRNPDQFASWLYGIALNQCRDYAKNVRRDTHPFSRSEQENAAVQDDETTAQDDRLIADEQGAHLWDALDELSATYDQIEIHDDSAFVRTQTRYEGRATPVEYVLKRLDVSVSTLKVRVHRARKKLRSLLEPYHEKSRS